MALTYLSGYANPPKRVTLEQLNKQTTWFLLHPEVRRRLLAMFDASEGSVGFGGGWRSYDQDAAEFRRRWQIVQYQTPMLFEGKYWVLRDGMATIMPPDRTYHTACVEGCAVAADLIGNLDWANAHGSEFALRDFSKLARPEPWHFQPAEIPMSRVPFNANPAAYPLHIWDPPKPPEPSPPTPQPPSHDGGDDIMRITIFSVRDSKAVFLGETTASGVALNVRWTGPGTPKIEAMLAAHRAAGAQDVTVNVEDLRNTFLLGPLPHGDVRTWTLDDFAGPEQPVDAAGRPITSW